MKSFLAFNQNAVSNFLYLLSSNGFSFLLVFGVLGTILLLLKEEYEIDLSIIGRYVGCWCFSRAFNA